MTAPKSNAELVGVLMQNIDEFLGERPWFEVEVHSGRAAVNVYSLDPERYGPYNADDYMADIRVQNIELPNDAGTCTVLTSKAVTLVEALRNTAAYLVFPPEAAHAHLRLVGGAS